MRFEGLTVKDLRSLKGVRQIAFVQVAREEEATGAECREIWLATRVGLSTTKGQ